MNDIFPPAGVSPSPPPRNPRAKTARQKLDELGFDPLVELVKTHRELGTEADKQRKVRDGELVVLKSDGKPRAYNSAQHMQALSEQGKIGGQLAEYMYKKAHQEVDNERPSVPFIINVNRS